MAKKKKEKKSKEEKIAKQDKKDKDLENKPKKNLLDQFLQKKELYQKTLMKQENFIIKVAMERFLTIKKYNYHFVKHYIYQKKVRWLS